jgi:hypothetical protein
MDFDSQHYKIKDINASFHRVDRDVLAKGAVSFQFKFPICDLRSLNIGWHS